MNKTIFSIEIKRIECDIIPDKIIDFDCSYKIVKFKQEEQMFHIKYYFVYLVNENLFNVFLPFLHPNCSLEDGIFCLPSFLKNKKFDSGIQDILERKLKEYNFASCYFTLWEYLEIEKL